MKNITTSVVLATYNWPQALELCLLSIANQTILPNEVVVADDGLGLGRGAAIDVAVLAEDVVIAHLEVSRLAFVLKVLSFQADNGKGEKLVVLAEG